MNKIWSFIIDRILGSKGYKTILINAIIFATGLWSAISESSIFDFACSYWPDTFCNVEQSAFYGAIIAVVAFLNKILRFLTTTPIFTRKKKAN